MGVTCAAGAGLGLDVVVEDGLGAEDEGAWWLSPGEARVGHVGAVVGRRGGMVVSYEWTMGMRDGGGGGDRKSRKTERVVQLRIDMRER